MNTLDLVILVTVFFGIIQGLFRGLVKELTSFAVIIVGIYGAKLLNPMIAKMLESVASFSPQMARPLAYLFSFILLAIAMFLLAQLFEKTLSIIQLGGLNKFLGAIVGGLKFLLVLSILLNVFDAMDERFHLINKATKEESLTYSLVLKAGPELWKEVKDKQSINEQNTHQQNKIVPRQNK